MQTAIFSAMVSNSPRKAASRPAPGDSDAVQYVSGFDHYFGISRRGSTVAREIRGGIVTFVTMAYIIALNPLILGTVADDEGKLINGLARLDQAGNVLGTNAEDSITVVAAATALVAGVMTILMGLIGRFPIGIAAGLGLNAILAFTLAPRMSWPQAMGLVVIEGVVILILVLTGFRTAVFKAVPESLRAGIAVGIGLFIAFVGLLNAGIVRRPAAPGGPPVELGVGGALLGWPAAVFLFGLLLMIILYALRVKGAILIAIAAATVGAGIVQWLANPGAVSAQNPQGWQLNVPVVREFFAMPDLRLIGKVDLFGAFNSAGQPASSSGGLAHYGILALIMLIFGLMLTDFFDSMGTVVAVGSEGKLLDRSGNPPHLTGILAVDSVSAIAGGVGSVSSNTAYVESSAGVAEGARTGFASVITGVLFLLAMFLAPLVKAIPSEAAATALVFVGFLMMGQVARVKWSDIEEGLPAFLTAALMPFTFSITVGIGAGFISYVLLKVVRGKGKEVHPVMYVVAAAFLLYFGQGVLQGWIG